MTMPRDPRQAGDQPETNPQGPPEEAYGNKGGRGAAKPATGDGLFLTSCGSWEGVFGRIGLVTGCSDFLRPAGARRDVL